MMNKRFLARSVAVSVLLVGTLDGLTRAQGPALSEVQVFPPDINLFTSRGKQTFVVQAIQADGITRDVTAEAKVTPAAAGVVRLEKNIVYPVADGATDLNVEF